MSLPLRMPGPMDQFSYAENSKSDSTKLKGEVRFVFSSESDNPQFQDFLSPKVNNCSVLPAAKAATHAPAPTLAPRSSPSPGPVASARATRSSRAVFILGCLQELWQPLPSKGLIAGRMPVGGAGVSGQSARPHAGISQDACASPWPALTHQPSTHLPLPAGGTSAPGHVALWAWTEASAHGGIFLSHPGSIPGSLCFCGSVPSLASATLR